MTRCPHCKNYMMFPNSHKCPPKWNVWPDHYDKEDARSLHATTAKEAVELWADDWDGGNDYTIVGGSPEIVHVEGEDGVVQKFRVMGEMVRRYSAYAATD